MFGLKLEGARELQRKLTRLGPRVEKKVVRQALRKGAKPILKQAKANAPRDTGVMSKAMIIRAARGRKRRGVAGVSGFFTTRKYPQLVRFSKSGKRYFYPAGVEYGTARMPARPFMRKAWDSKKREALAIVMREMWRGVEREAAKA